MTDMATPRRRRPPGRPTILNREIEEAIIESLEQGVPIAHAARSAGIAEDTFHSWVGKGNKELERLDALRKEGQPAVLDPQVRAYVQFAEVTTHARARHIRNRITRVNRTAEGGIIVQRTETTRTLKDGTVLTEVHERYAPPNPAADLFMLERHPESRPDFGRKDRIEHSGPDGGEIPMSLRMQAKDDLVASIERAAERLNGNGSTPVDEVSRARDTEPLAGSPPGLS